MLDIATEHKSKIMMVAGNVWTNLKKMWTDGSMEIEMNQAVAGIKGTTLICEEANGVSTLKVLEGTVEFTSKATGEAVCQWRTDGQRDEDGLGEIKPFDIEKRWRAGMKPRSRSRPTRSRIRAAGSLCHHRMRALGAVTLVLTVVLLHVSARRSRSGRRAPDVPGTVPVIQCRPAAFCAACAPARACALRSYGIPKNRPAADHWHWLPCRCCAAASTCCLRWTEVETANVHPVHPQKPPHLPSWSR